MARGGKRENAGRKPNTTNKATKERQAKIESTGATPLDAMIRKMRWHLAKADREEAKGSKADAAVIEMALDKADEAARGAGPYVHPRLAAIEHMGKGGGPIEYSDVRDRLAHLIAREAAAGQTIEDPPTTH
jgi:hypothetical protein